jgi:manganese/zinc/iron transport system substrate-binding protein
MNTTLRLRVAFILLILSALVGACGGEEDVDLALRQVRVVATTGMIADAAAHVGGERAQVTGLMGPGVDPHLYNASEGDVTRLRSADLIFYNGLHLEAQMANVLERMDGSGVTTVAVAGDIDPSLLLAPPEFAGAYDPHVWFDVSLWMQVVEKIRASYVELDPEHAAVYEANAAAYREELAALHDYVGEQASLVPEERRVLVTAHDAFNYFGRAYGFEVRGLQGISTEAEASTADVQQLATFIAERRIPAIFVESSVPQRNVEAVQAAVRAQGYNVVIGGQLFSDAMGNAGTPEGTYTGMVRHNIDTIVSALLAGDA